MMKQGNKATLEKLVSKAQGHGLFMGQHFHM